MATLRLENERQVALWNSEITGQLSDGAWENTNPMDHYKPWIDCVAVVASEGEEPGRDFWVRKDGYALHSLIEYVGDRMVFYGNLANLLDEVPEGALPEGQWEWDFIQDKATDPDYPGDYYMKRFVELDDAGITDEIIAQAAEGDYGIKELRKDLTAIKKAMKNRLLENLA